MNYKFILFDDGITNAAERREFTNSPEVNATERSGARQSARAGLPAILLTLQEIIREIKSQDNLIIKTG